MSHPLSNNSYHRGLVKFISGSIVGLCYNKKLQQFISDSTKYLELWFSKTTIVCGGNLHLNEN